MPIALFSAVSGTENMEREKEKAALLATLTSRRPQGSSPVAPPPPSSISPSLIPPARRPPATLIATDARQAHRRAAVERPHCRRLPCQAAGRQALWHDCGPGDRGHPRHCLCACRRRQRKGKIGAAASSLGQPLACDATQAFLTRLPRRDCWPPSPLSRCRSSRTAQPPARL